MNNPDTQENIDVAVPTTTETTVEPTVAAASAAIKGKVTPGRRMRDSAKKVGPDTGPNKSGARSGGRGGNRGGDSRERVRPDIDSKMIDIRRVTRVSSGGRRYSFSVAVVVGDRKGRVGVGLGKGADTAISIEKATREAKKHMIKVPLSPQMLIPHRVEAKYGSARIIIFPARGRSVVAGSSARTVIELAGIKDVCAKIMSGSKNKINIARAAIAALDSLIKIPRSTIVPKTK